MIDTRKYYTIVAFNKLKDLLAQIEADNLNKQQLHQIRFENDSSMFELAIAYNNYEIANYLIDIDTPINVVTKEGWNEFHYLASHLKDSQAITIGNLLLERGVDLAQKDRKYGNTALLSLIIGVINKRSFDQLAFICRCVEKDQGLFEQNKTGKCAFDFLVQYGIEEGHFKNEQSVEKQPPKQ
ncbi:MAG: hypothetical protein IK127_09080 [Clostridia bacterium]|nr:hypothetical protein [Clostridia bacterium]